MLGPGVGAITRITEEEKEEEVEEEEEEEGLGGGAVGSHPSSSAAVWLAGLCCRLSDLMGPESRHAASAPADFILTSVVSLFIYLSVFARRKSCFCSSFFFSQDVELPERFWTQVQRRRLSSDLHLYLY